MEFNKIECVPYRYSKSMFKQTMFNLKTTKKKVIKTQAREIPIDPTMLNQKMAIHNGRIYKLKEVNLNMLYHKLGSFSATRVSHKFKQKKPKAKK